MHLGIGIDLSPCGVGDSRGSGHGSSPEAEASLSTLK